MERERAELALLKHRGEELVKDEANVTADMETLLATASTARFVHDSKTLGEEVIEKATSITGMWQD